MLEKIKIENFVEACSLEFRVGVFEYEKQTIALAGVTQSFNGEKHKLGKFESCAVLGCWSDRLHITHVFFLIFKILILNIPSITRSSTKEFFIPTMQFCALI